MGVLSLDSYIRKTFPRAIKYYKKGQRVSQKMVCLALDANPFVYAACAKAFEMGDYKTMLSVNTLSYEEKIKLSFQLTWEEIQTVVGMIDTEQVYIAFDSSVPVSKQMEQRRRRYIRGPTPEDEFDLTNLSAGTQYMYDLCSFIQFKIQEVDGWGCKKVIFSSVNSAGEGEAKCIRYLRTFPPKTPVAIYGPDADLFQLALGSAQNVFVFKQDYSTNGTTDPQYYTVCMQPIRNEINNWTKSRNMARPVNFVDSIKSFILLCNILGNDFNRRIEAFELFIEGIDNLLYYYHKLRFSIISDGRLDRKCLSNLLRLLADDEPMLLSQKVKYPYPLLEKYLSSRDDDKKPTQQTNPSQQGRQEQPNRQSQPTQVNNHRTNSRFDFEGFRKEYYKEWVGIESEQDIQSMCCNYLDTIWWTFQYYTSFKGVPNWTHYYKYHYPPFCIDLYKCSLTWQIPKWEETHPRRPFEQLVSVLPPNRKGLLPKEHRHFFKDESLSHLFPDLKDIVKNVQGRNEKFETIYEIPFFDATITIEDNNKINRLTIDRVFIPSTETFKLVTKWGKCKTHLEG